MKFKETAIAMAVAGTVAAPAVQAGADEIYASARVGVWNVDEGDTSDPEIRSFASRFGARGETDLGNGLTGFGRYEWNVDFRDRDGDLSGDGSFRLRHRYVGLKGDFGSIRLGETHHTFFTFVVDPFDRPWWHSGYAMVAYVGRTDDGITYAGNAGNFAFGATAYMVREEEEDPIDVAEVAASYTFGNDMVLAVGGIATKADEDDGTGTLIGNFGVSDETVVGVSLSGIMLGDFGLVFNFQSQDDDTSFGNNIVYGSFYLHTELHFIDEDSPSNFSVDGEDQDRSSVTLGYTQALGLKTTMWYEINHEDQDAGTSDFDRTAVMAVLKYDII
jgi:predicted porin